jgi:hypothetical protein
LDERIHNAERLDLEPLLDDRFAVLPDDQATRTRFLRGDNESLKSVLIERRRLSRLRGGGREKAK